MEKRVSMDPLLRGLCEQHIDQKLYGNEIQDISDLVDVLDLPVSSKEDAVLGMFLGTIYKQLSNQCMKVYDRSPEREEILDYHLILKRRSREVKSKITELYAPKMADVLQDSLIKPMEYLGAGLQIESEDSRQNRNESEMGPDEGEKPLPEIKINFRSRSRNPIRSILGIPLSRSKRPWFLR